MMQGARRFGNYGFERIQPIVDRLTQLGEQHGGKTPAQASRGGGPLELQHAGGSGQMPACPPPPPPPSAGTFLPPSYPLPGVLALDPMPTGLFELPYLQGSGAHPGGQECVAGGRQRRRAGLAVEQRRRC